jgi:hypothetical protein
LSIHISKVFAGAVHPLLRDEGRSVIRAREGEGTMGVENRKTRGLIDALDSAGWTVDSFSAERVKLCASNTEEATGYFELRVFEKAERNRGPESPGEGD